MSENIIDPLKNNKLLEKNVKNYLLNKNEIVPEKNFSFRDRIDPGNKIDGNYLSISFSKQHLLLSCSRTFLDVFWYSIILRKNTVEG